MKLSRLSEAELSAMARVLPEWEVSGSALRRTFEAESDEQALAWVLQIGRISVEKNHHPELTWLYRSVTLVWSTHDVGGVSRLDLEMAAQSNKICKAGAAL